MLEKLKALLKKSYEWSGENVGVSVQNSEMNANDIIIKMREEIINIIKAEE